LGAYAFYLYEDNRIAFGPCACNQVGQILYKTSQKRRALFAALQSNHLKFGFELIQLGDGDHIPRVWGGVENTGSEKTWNRARKDFNFFSQSRNITDIAQPFAIRLKEIQRVLLHHVVRAEQLTRRRVCPNTLYLRVGRQVQFMLVDDSVQSHVSAPSFCESFGSGHSTGFPLNE
jgi:hypothetical protein